MQSTMADGDLTIGRLLRYGGTVQGRGTVRTWTGADTRSETYAEVATRAGRLASALRSLGIDGDQRVATFMWNNNEHLEAYLGIPAMGAVLHTLNIRLAPEQLSYVVNHAQDSVIIVDATVLPLLEPVLPTMDSVRHVVVVGGDPATLEAPAGVTVHGYDELLDAHEPQTDWPALDERSAAALCYTSGTTGDPKGVAYSHRSIWLHSMQVCAAQTMALTARDTVLAVVPMFHAMSWGLPYAAMMSGASLVMPDRYLQPEPLAAIMQAERPTFAAAVPTIWQGLNAQLEQHPQDISHLREVIVGGSACPPSLMRAFEERYDVPVIQAWGMTETSPLGSVARVPSWAEGDEAWALRTGQGQFPASVEARIVDDAGSVLPWDDEAVGELEVTGPWIADSYYSPDGQSDALQANFDDGWLRTGDVGRITPDGFLTLTDRAKDVIKSGGEWISSVELENILMGHPDVVEAAAIAIPDEKWQERPLMTVVLKDGSSTTTEQLRDYLAPHLAKWQLPDSWAYIDEVPKTSVGKFDKKRLRARFQEGDLTVEHL
ncbi:long-chain fatty acid--CoA ligase [Flexivirga sp. ID2601S]|uniref:Long-chain fatty acid--CoA ligase n=1 Tax=Flexivirga aerilata TaxID=1656889 RepID=A0A849AP68_9MICO|nr:long-chain fatty acid--CoA ligase [Flexivirga aerilata]